MKFRYGDVVRIKSGFFAGLEGKCVDAFESKERFKAGQGVVKLDKPIWEYSISINGVKTEPFEAEDNLEPVAYTVDYEKEQKQVDSA